ncbi:MAG TPA: hypothetical protein VHD56_05365 [Tepidisphaeraceae bacterium]|nr:hypothetical protein [Tepidisphaeraceae bacterium]
MNPITPIDLIDNRSAKKLQGGKCQFVPGIFIIIISIYKKWYYDYFLSGYLCKKWVLAVSHLKMPVPGMMSIQRWGNTQMREDSAHFVDKSACPTRYMARTFVQFHGAYRQEFDPQISQMTRGEFRILDFGFGIARNGSAWRNKGAADPWIFVIRIWSFVIGILLVIGTWSLTI